MSDTQSLEAAFTAWSNALNGGDLATFWDACHARSEFLDEDYPWRMSKAEFQDHIAFHAAGGGTGLWEFFQWIPRDLNYLVIGDTGHISGYATFRGKPRECGFRQRFMGFTHTWVREQSAWKLLCFHQSPLEARIVGASPS
jgi:ketosteroid isomerase-like protein